MPAPKRVLISVTHMNSGSLPLMAVLSNNPRVQVMTSIAIQDYTDLRLVTAATHKHNTVAAMYAFEVNFNYQLGPRTSFPHAQYLFVVRRPDQMLNDLVTDPARADYLARYYCYRLRRICEIAKRVKHGALLTYEDLRNGDYVPFLKSFLSLKEDLIHVPELFVSPKQPSRVSKRTMDWCSDCYERHLYFLKNLPLKTINRG